MILYASLQSNFYQFTWKNFSYTSCAVNPLHMNEFHSESVFVKSSSVSSVAQLCLTCCDLMDYSTPSFPVHHRLLELIQTRVHWVGDVIQPSHPLPSPSPPAFNFSQHQGLFQRVSSSHQVAKVLEIQLQRQSLQWIFRVDLSPFCSINPIWFWIPQS